MCRPVKFGVDGDPKILAKRGILNNDSSHVIERGGGLRLEENNMKIVFNALKDSLDSTPQSLYYDTHFVEILLGYKRAFIKST